MALTGLVGASTLLAQTESPPAQPLTGSVAYISGGIGSDEAAALLRAAPRYPLTLELAATPSGGWRDEYIADAKVDIRDDQGRTMLSTVAEGPLFLIRLPSGRYTVEVAWNGTLRRKTVDIATGKPQHIVFEFPNRSDG